MILSSSELNTLEHYKFLGQEPRRENQFFLAVKNTGSFFNRKHELTKVKRQDVTAWEVFKSHFGLGKLAGCNLRLTAVAKHLGKYDLRSLNIHSGAYDTIHAVASRVLFCKLQIPQLWKNLATETKEFRIVETTQYHDPNNGEKTRTYTSSSKLPLLITPQSTVAHLAAQVNILKKTQCEPSFGFNRSDAVATKDLATLEFQTREDQDDWQIRRYSLDYNQDLGWSGHRRDSVWT